MTSNGFKYIQPNESMPTHSTPNNEEILKITGKEGWKKVTDEFKKFLDNPLYALLVGNDYRLSRRFAEYILTDSIVEDDKIPNREKLEIRVVRTHNELKYDDERGPDDEGLIQVFQIYPTIDEFMTDFRRMVGVGYKTVVVDLWEKSGTSNILAKNKVVETKEGWK